jgi:hypothetical protein
LLLSERGSGGVDGRWGRVPWAAVDLVELGLCSGQAERRPTVCSFCDWRNCNSSAIRSLTSLTTLSAPAG